MTLVFEPPSLFMFFSTIFSVSKFIYFYIFSKKFLKQSVENVYVKKFSETFFSLFWTFIKYFLRKCKSNELLLDDIFFSTSKHARALQRDPIRSEL